MELQCGRFYPPEAINAELCRVNNISPFSVHVHKAAFEEALGVCVCVTCLIRSGIARAILGHLLPEFRLQACKHALCCFTAKFWGTALCCCIPLAARVLYGRNYQGELNVCGFCELLIQTASV